MILFGLTALAAILVASQSARVLSPSWDEVGHLGAGIYHWQTGKFDAYHVNPPVPRIWATLPVRRVAIDADPRFPSAYSATARREWSLAESLWEWHGEDVFAYVTQARLMQIPILLLGAAVAAWWARQVWPGAQAADAALVCGFLGLVDPLNLAATVTLTPDLFATTFGLIANVMVWRYLQLRSFRAAIIAGLAMGLAISCKTTWLLLTPVWLIAAIWLRPGRVRSPSAALTTARSSQEAPPSTPTAPSPEAASSAEIVADPDPVPVPDPVPGLPSLSERVSHILIAGIVALASINACYLGDGFGKSLRSSPAASRPFIEMQRTSLAQVPLPLPEWLVRGIDLQKSEFEKGYTSYFCGEYRNHGFLLYYLLVFCLKWPTLWIALLIVGLVSGVFRLRGASILVWIVPSVLFVAVSAHTGFSHHLRYIGPVTPYLHMLIAGLVSRVSGRGRLLIAFALLIGGIDVLRQGPQLLAYHNEIASIDGDPSIFYGRGSYDSTVDWGQNLLLLAEWCHKHPEVELAGYASDQMEPAIRAAGLPSLPPPAQLPRQVFDSTRQQSAPCIWYALELKQLYREDERYSDFQLLTPAAVLGGTIFIYRVPDPTGALKTSADARHSLQTLLTTRERSPRWRSAVATAGGARLP